MSNRAYIYSLRDPEDGPELQHVRYIGKTTGSLQARFNRHITAANDARDRSHRANWIRKLLREGRWPLMVVLEETTPGRASEREMWWIRHCRKNGCRLTNSTDGGEGLLNPSKEVRRRIGAAKKGHKFWVGKRHTEQARQRISWKRKGRYGGEKHPLASLTWNQVWEIRRIYAEGDRVMTDIARQFGVAYHVVQDILSQLTWMPQQPTFEQWDLLRKVEASIDAAKRGERRGHSKLTEEQVREIRDVYAEGKISQDKLAGLYGVTQTIVHRVLTGKSWAHLGDTEELASAVKRVASKAKAGERNGRARLTLEQAREIRRLYLTGECSQKRLAAMYNVGLTTIWHLLQGHTWPEPDANTVA